VGTGLVGDAGCGKESSGAGSVGKLESCGAGAAPPDEPFRGAGAGAAKTGVRAGAAPPDGGGAGAGPPAEGSTDSVGASCATLASCGGFESPQRTSSSPLGPNATAKSTTPRTRLRAIQITASGFLSTSRMVAERGPGGMMKGWKSKTKDRATRPLTL